MQTAIRRLLCLLILLSRGVFVAIVVMVNFSYLILGVFINEQGNNIFHYKPKKNYSKINALFSTHKVHEMHNGCTKKRYWQKKIYSGLQEFMKYYKILFMITSLTDMQVQLQWKVISYLSLSSGSFFWLSKLSVKISMASPSWWPITGPDSVNKTSNSRHSGEWWVQEV